MGHISNLSPGATRIKRAVVRQQLQEAIKTGLVTCRCGATKSTTEAYRCFYCCEFYCEECAPGHFGKTREEYYKEKEQRRCSGYKVFPGGEKCPGCPDCNSSVHHKGQSQK